MTKTSDDETHHGLDSEGGTDRRGAAVSGGGSALGQGDVVGRYVVLTRLGVGGMGVVYAAYDPELDRKLALKLLHAEAGAGSDGRARLLAEAQSLARLAHPNVVAVHDVGVVDDRVWLAMELVEGRTLDRWCAERRRSWVEVLELAIPVCRGLAAAHSAGLVHRDVKPQNVMVASDGRVRVMDFGLARSRRAEEAARRDTSPSPHPTVRALELELTRDGALVGTPAYMAPEQLAGVAVDARADQFSVCVMVWEALWRRRPFVGETVAALATKVLEGRIEPPPPDARVPRWLNRILRRGLAVDREDRFADIDALREAFELGHARVRRRRIVVVVGAIAGAAAVVAAVVAGLDRRRVAACEAEGAAIVQVWNDDVRADVHDAILATGLDYAESTAALVTPWIDDSAQSWQVARTEACLDATLRGSWSAERIDRSQWCFDEHRLDLAAVVDELAAADPETVRYAVVAASALAAVDVCRDGDWLDRLQPPPADVRERAVDVRSELSRVRAHELAGRFPAGLARARAAHEEAERLGFPPLVVATLVQEASLQERVGDYEAAAKTARQAYFEAATAGVWHLAATAATELVIYVGDRGGQPSAGQEWAEHAKVALGHAGDPQGLGEAHRLANLAVLLNEIGDAAGARALLERALALDEAALGPRHPLLVAPLANLANASYQSGDLVEAIALHERALAIAEEAYGAMHPLAALALLNLGNVCREAGDYARARELLERAGERAEIALGPEHPQVAASSMMLAELEVATGNRQRARELLERALVINERALGPDHPDVAANLLALANELRHLGKNAEARERYERALAIWERALGPDHPNVAAALGNLASMAVGEGDLERGRELAERALAIQQEAYGPEHPDVGDVLHHLGSIAEQAGDLRRARELYGRALAIREKAFGPEHTDVAESLMGLARVDLAEHHDDAALTLAVRALAIHDAHSGTPDDEIAARFLLARALLAAGGDRDRAVALAEQALAAWRADPESNAQNIAAVTAWLAEQALPKR